MLDRRISTWSSSGMLGGGNALRVGKLSSCVRPLGFDLSSARGGAGAGLSELFEECRHSLTVGDIFRGRFVFGESLTLGALATMLDWVGHSQAGLS
jgi:hypothetical protein